MNLKKFVAIDAREALKQVKETLGDDAVILSNRTIPGGVEMTAIPQKEINDLPSANLPSNQNQIQNQNRNQNQNQNQNLDFFQEIEFSIPFLNQQRRIYFFNFK